MQQSFDQGKKELTDESLRLAVPNSEKPFYILCDASNYGIGATLLQKNQFGKMGLVSADSRLFSTTEHRLSAILRECSAIIYALSEYEFFIKGSKHPVILYTDHKPILSLFNQKNKPNHRVYKFQLILMKFTNLHIVRTEGKNLSLPDLLSRSLTTTTQDENRLRTVEIPEKIKFFITHNPNTQPIQCNYAVSKKYINSVSTDINVESTHFPIYLQIKNNYFKVQLENDLYLPFHIMNFIPKRNQ